MRMINIIINGVEVWENIEADIIKLGKFHASIGQFSAEDYENISDTLL